MPHYTHQIDRRELRCIFCDARPYGRLGQQPCPEAAHQDRWVDWDQPVEVIEDYDEESV